MAKVTGGLFSLTASGTVGKAITFDKRGWVRNRVIPLNRQTATQMAVRWKLGNVQRINKEVGVGTGAGMKFDLTALLGYRWSALIGGEVLANDAAKYDAYYAEYAAFEAGEKTAWETANPAVGQIAPATGAAEATPGAIFYAVAKATYDVCMRVAGSAPFVEPASDNAATIGAAWIATT